MPVHSPGSTAPAGAFLILSNEGCDLCSECTYPEAPCRFPDRSHGSIEG
ncbi:MAG: DUF2284 domain-containing protein [Lachnospiraceae bacterium]